MSTIGYKIAWAAAAALGAAYCLVFLRFAPLLLQDYPNHLARAVVVNDLLFHGGVRFGGTFQYGFVAMPYILNDLLLASAIEPAGVKVAAGTWPVLIFLSLPCAVLFYTRVLKLRREGQIVAFLLSLYLATNAFYFRGFLAFSLAVSTIVVVLAQARLRRERPRPTPLLFAMYCTVLAAGYLIHLATLVFVTAAAAVCAALHVWRRTTTLRTEIWLFLPIAALLVWHFSVHGAVPAASSSIAYDWGTVVGKIQRFDWNFIRFNRRPDHAMLWLCILCAASQARFLRSRRALASPNVIEMLALALTFIGIYLVLPLNLANVAWVDVRALPMIALFLILACLAPTNADSPSPRPLASALGILLALLLAGGNLLHLTPRLYRLDEWLIEYRAVVAAVPKGAWVFTVYTNTRDRPIKSTLHAGAFTVIDREAPNPYLFSKDLGDPMQYFSYRRRPYAPDEDWYVRPQGASVDWPAIVRSYDFLLVMKPFDPARVPIATLPVFETAAAALFDIRQEKSAHAEGAPDKIE
jgi:hypothetical protein